MCSGGINQILFVSESLVGMGVGGGHGDKVMIVEYKNNVQFYIVHTSKGKVEA